MTVKILQAKPAPDVQAIAVVEHALGRALPKEYVEFAAEFNGGVPQTNAFPIDYGRNESGVNEFVALEHVVEEMELGGFDVLQGFFPFAYAEGGNYVCVEAATGGVFFWDHELEADSGGLVKLAESIFQFLVLVMPFDPSQVKMKSGQVKNAWIDPDFLDN